MAIKTHKITAESATYSSAESGVPLLARISGDTRLPSLTPANAKSLSVVDAAGKNIPAAVGVNPILKRGNYAWTWFTRPMASRYVGGRDCTRLVPFDYENRQWVMVEADHQTKQVTEVVLYDGPNPTQNDHNAGSVVHASDGTIIAAVSDHSISNVFFFVSDSPESMTSFTRTTLDGTNGTPNAVRATYPQLAIYGNKVFLSWREFNNSQRPRVFAVYDLSTETWSAVNQLAAITDNRPYLHQVADGSKIHCVFSYDHPLETAAQTCDLYHAYYNLDDNNFYKSDGTLIGAAGTVSLNDTNATLVADASVIGANMWPSDIGIDSSGQPRVVFTSHPDEYQNRCYYASYRGGYWVSTFLANLGESIYTDSTPSQPQYQAGCCIDRDSPDSVYYVIHNAGGTEVFNAKTRDAGETFAVTRVSSGNTARAYRPFVPTNSHPDFKVGWLSGDYRSFLDVRNCSVASFPKATEYDVDIVIEADLLGSEDFECYLQVNDQIQALDDPFNDAIIRSFGSCNNARLVNDSRILNNQEFTAIVSVDAEGSGLRSILSNWMPDANERHFLFRTDASSRLQALVVDSANTQVTVVATDKVIGTGIQSFAVKYDGTLKVGSGGSVSAVTASGASKLDSIAVPSDIGMGYSPHNNFTSNTPMAGIGFAALIFATAKSDVWIGLATNGLASEGITIDAVSVSTVIKIDTLTRTVNSKVGFKITWPTPSLTTLKLQQLVSGTWTDVADSVVSYDAARDVYVTNSTTASTDAVAATLTPEDSRVDYRVIEGADESTAIEFDVIVEAAVGNGSTVGSTVTGPRRITLTFEDADGDPVKNVIAEIEDGDLQISDPSGILKLGVANNSSSTISIHPPYGYSIPDDLVIAVTTVNVLQTVTLEKVPVPASTNPNACQCTLTVLTAHQEPIDGAILIATTANSVTFAADALIFPTQSQAVSDNGQIIIYLTQGVTYKVTVSYNGKRIQFDLAVPEESTASIPAIVIA